jgi:DNA-3-methyladenine glycosylase
MKLDESFYERANVVKIARDLLGKALFTCVGGVVTGGIIVETEAYSWKERGCHAFGGKKTGRNAVMFERGGRAYVYLCYGMHQMFNVVTNRDGIAEAVLIRALQPLAGTEVMQLRRGLKADPAHLTTGPGKLARALGIDRSLNGKLLTENEIWLEDIGNKVAARKIVAGPRIGIDYAGDDAMLPWRFYVRENLWVSR